MRAMQIRSAAVVLGVFVIFAAFGQDKFKLPDSPRERFDFNADWRFVRAAKPEEDISGFEAAGFNDSKWEVVSTPHSFNDVDSFRTIISHSGGDRGAYRGLAFYRKHFKLPESMKGRNVFIEFEGMRQAGQIFLNGKQVGLSENGVTPYGIDLSGGVNFGDQENVLAVRIDNRTTYAEQATKTTFEWNANATNPNYGGINRRVWLDVTGKIYQTLPVYDGLQTQGTYIYPSNISVADHSADITVDSQVHNGSDDQATVAMEGVVVDRDGIVRAKLSGEPLDMVSGEKSPIEVTGHLADAHLWSVNDPYLYDVYTILKVDDKVVDVVKTTTGFRKVDFKGGAGTGGVYINDKFVYLKGFAQRATNEWAGIGQAYPEWMHDLTAKQIRDCNGNYVRWMHVAPQAVDVQAFDRYGIVQVCPAGDKERDATGRQWEQRMEVMRDTIIYFRNDPSILFWEAGNNGITSAHMKQMVDLRAQWDPHGGRVMGCRTLEGRGEAEDAENTKTAEYYGIMVGQDPKTDALKEPTAMFRAYSAERRDRAPLIECEDFRDESARRYWDDFSPPYFGFKPGPEDTYSETSEQFVLKGVKRYWDYWSNRISNTDPAHAKWSGYASIYFSDSDADGRQQSSETCRVSGKVDAMRLPKELYFATRVMQAEKPDIHIVGHWTYPADTKKTVYVVANTKSVELLLNGKSVGVNSEPTNGFVFAFPDVQFQPGTLKAVGKNEADVVCEHELTTVGAAVAIKLTPVVGPGGLRADGEDVALFDVEVVDAKGQRCPTDDDRVDFTCTGPAVWRGGYNSGKKDSTNNLFVNTECGVNRVAVRATREAGMITVTASRKGLESAKVTVESRAVKVVDGLMALSDGK
jgi:beta-galactosidase